MREVEKARDDQKEYTEKQPSELKKKKKNPQKTSKQKATQPWSSKKKSRKLFFFMDNDLYLKKQVPETTRYTKCYWDS